MPKLSLRRNYKLVNLAKWGHINIYALSIKITHSWSHKNLLNNTIQKWWWHDLCITHVPKSTHQFSCVIRSFNVLWHFMGKDTTRHTLIYFTYCRITSSNYLKANLFKNVLANIFFRFFVSNFALLTTFVRAHKCFF